MRGKFSHLISGKEPKKKKKKTALRGSLLTIPTKLKLTHYDI